MTIMTLSARQVRLARPKLSSSFRFRAPLSLRRPFSASIAQRSDETATKDEALPRAADNKQSDILNSARMALRASDSTIAQLVPDITGKNIPKAINSAPDRKYEDPQPQKQPRLSKLASTKEERAAARAAKKQASKGRDPARGGEDKYDRPIFGGSRRVPIRTRFAPSPTGDLHLGSMRTALVNNLVALTSKEGEFIIRSEDTDQKRLVPGAEKRVFQDLKWLGLEWSEGPDKGGPYGPYRQSERLPIYEEHAKKLLETGSAYRCFCSKETLEAQMKVDLDAGRHTVYPGTCRSIPPEESDERALKGEAYTVRMNSEKFGRPKLVDAVYGEFQKKFAEEDFVLMKTDGYPTYHLANVVDDHLMKITHVIRGEEWLISTPKHLALYQAFGWEPPTFVHLPLLTEDDGSKLSKRNASVNIASYKQQHVLPVAMQSWLANLGSSFYPKTPTPRSLQDVSDALTFQFTRGGIKLNPEKLFHFQNAYRQEIFSLPGKMRTAAEHRLINDEMVHPLLKEVDHLTTRTSPNECLHITSSFIPWIGPLDPVPSISSKSPQIRDKYAFKVLTADKTNFKTLRDLANNLCYLFWRPPLVAYRYAVAHYEIDPHNFAVLKRVIDCPPADWDDVLRVDKNWEELSKLDPAVVHGMIRLILVGDPLAQTRNTGTMFKVLGQSECHHRLRIVEGLMKELEAEAAEGKRDKADKWYSDGLVAAEELMVSR